MSVAALLVAHGSRAGGSQRVVNGLADKVRALVPGAAVVAAFLDHDPITARLGLQLLRAEGADRAIVVPVLLSGAFHVFQDLPAQLAGGLPSTVTAHLGPDARVVAALAQLLPEAAPAAVVLAATGSSDPRVRAEVEQAAQLLSATLAAPVIAAFLSAAEPTLPDAVLALRRQGLEPVIAPYLLAEGTFYDLVVSQCEELGVLHGPVLGAHPQLAALIAERILARLTGIE